MFSIMQAFVHLYVEIVHKQVWRMEVFHKQVNDLLPADNHGMTILYQAHYEKFHAKVVKSGINNSYTTGCRPVRGDNPQALASGLSYVQVDKHGITI